MHINTENILLTGSVLLLISVIAGKTTHRLGVPTLIFFLIVGILAGSEGIGGIHFDDANVARFIGVTALNFILFSGGLDTHWETIKPVFWRGVALSTLGVFLTAASLGLFAWWVLGLSWLQGLLLGSIVSATDAAAVFSILRNRGIALKGWLRPVLELESGSNDPMAYFLTITLTSAIMGDHSNAGEFIIGFFKEFLLGGALGFLMGKGSVWVVNHIKLEAVGLYPVLVLGLAMFTYSVTHAIGGNGFLAIYLSAVIIGNSKMVHRRSLIRFYDGQAWIMQIVLFLTLGLLVFPSRIFPLIGIGLLMAAFLMFVARPLGVFISLAFFKSNVRSKLFVSWVGLRGGVPIVFATYPLIAGVPDAELIFNLVFFISISSVLLQGTTLAWVARLLHVSLPARARRKTGETDEDMRTNHEMTEVFIEATSPASNRQIVELGIPPGINILAIQRDSIYITPVGSTKLQKGDKLYVIAQNKESLAQLERLLCKETIE